MNHTLLLLRSFSIALVLAMFFTSTIPPHKHTADTPTASILEKLILLGKWTSNCKRLKFPYIFFKKTYPVKCTQFIAVNYNTSKKQPEFKIIESDRQCILTFAVAEGSNQL